MNYLEELMNRSVILWQSLFETNGLWEKELSVEIDSILFTGKTNEKFARQRTQKGAAYEGAVHDNQPRRENGILGEKLLLNGWEEERALSLMKAKTQRVAEHLLRNLQRAETVNVAGAFSAVEHENVWDVNRMKMADPASWSGYFERDARRYDGGYELM